MRVRRYLISVLSSGVALAALVATTLTSAAPIVIEPPGTVEAQFRVSFRPNALPAGRHPVSLALSEQVATRDGSHPPALQELQVELDRHLALSVKGLPICPRTLNSSGPRTDTIAKCEDAKVGSGTMEVEVAFPEQQPVRITGRVSVYNGGFSGGRTTLWAYTLLPAPVTGIVLEPLEFRRGSHGRYALKGSLALPKIANGAASLTSLELSLRKGLFSASCPGGKIQSHATSRFTDGSALSNGVVRTCRTLGSG